MVTTHALHMTHVTRLHGSSFLTNYWRNDEKQPLWQTDDFCHFMEFIHQQVWAHNDELDDALDTENVQLTSNS